MNTDQATIRPQAVSPIVRSISRPDEPREGFTTIGGREMYCIPRFDTMPPFLMSIASDSDLWMYVSSTGGLTCGRRSPETCLFPYETDDRLHHLRGVTGPITLIREDDSPDTWEPFCGPAAASGVSRNLYKNTLGTVVMFEETHHGLGLTFRYAWQNCDEFGFVRTATLVNHSAHRARSFEIVDGLLNVMPAGVQLGVQQGSSCLADAYKVCEVDRGTKLGIFSMNSLVTDRAEPSECLRANVVWCRGLGAIRVALAGRHLDSFRTGRTLPAESRMRGQRGNYLVSANIQLKPGQAMSWDIVGDVGRTQRQVGELMRLLHREPLPNAVLRERLDASRNNLVRIVAGSDGLQAAADKSIAVHHFANVLFNTMRGGSYANRGKISRGDFIRSVQTRNKAVAAKHAAFLEQLPERVSSRQLITALQDLGDTDLLRLGYEYLPITFGRRHGDPSRPWNLFDIQLHDESGSPKLAYQGNWRDIFQNWEALSLSYPEYLTSVIAKFVNASTADGFNPYRVTHEGIDWEAPEPHNPWSNIGYWGDHQIVYLTRLLELSQRFEPGRLSSLLAEPIFSYADVPYRIKPYAQMVKDCRHTIDFDFDHHRATEQDAAATGTDAKLLRTARGEVIHVALAEKLIVPVLAKLSNFVIGGGVWMNTQRPEWNDANNALAGFGLSVVTVCNLRRHVKLLGGLLESSSASQFAFSSEVATWLRQITAALTQNVKLTDSESIAASDRKSLLDQLGSAFCSYRTKLYAHGIGAPVAVLKQELTQLLDLADRYIAHTIHLNRRSDGLYHSYNLIKFSADQNEAAVERLPVMLEGQVAALSSGLLSTAQAADMVDALYASDLYRADQRSFSLYPDRPAKEFLQKNVAPLAAANRIDLLRRMLAAADRRIVAADGETHVRFQHDLLNEAALNRRLDEIARDPNWSAAVAADRAAIGELYESVFEHHSFTGRSGSMFGYEGLGCIYWHMVAKLLVAVQELYVAAERSGESKTLLARMADGYYRIRSGLGFNKTAGEYGAFPTDPYSHTPAHAGARQPGMTGQVKEEMISRLGELGVRIENGAIRFAPTLLDRREFIVQPSKFHYIDVAGAPATADIPADGLAFTFCQVPVIYRLAAESSIQVIRASRGIEIVAGDRLSAADSAEVFARSGSIVRLEVAINGSQLRRSPQILPGFQSSLSDSVALSAPDRAG